LRARSPDDGHLRPASLAELIPWSKRARSAARSRARCWPRSYARANRPARSSTSKGWPR
jgi:hypothetical protein